MYLRLTLLGLIVFLSAADCLAQTTFPSEVESHDELVPEDECVLELDLPDGATVEIDGKEYGTQREIGWQDLNKNLKWTVKLTATFPNNERVERKLLLRAGHRVRLPMLSPDAEMPKLVLQSGHTRTISAVAFSPDGRQIVTRGKEKTILWEVASGRRLRTFDGGHSFSVGSVAFSSDGRQLLTGADEKTAILWDVVSGQKLKTLQGHTHYVTSVAFSPDGHQLLTGSQDKTAILWDAVSGRKLKTFKGHAAPISSVAFSPDERQFLTGSGDDTAILWNAASGRKLMTFEGHKGTVTSVAFSPDGLKILTGSYDNTAILWDTTSGRKLRDFQGHTSSVRSVAFSPDGLQVLTSSYDNTAILWDTTSGHKLRDFQGHTNSVQSVAFSPDGLQILTGSDDRTAILWNAEDSRKLAIFKGHTSRVHPVAFSPDGRQLFTGTWVDTAILWDTETGKKSRTLEGDKDSVSCVSFRPDGRQILTGSYEGTASLWEVASGRKLRTLKGHKSLRSAAFSPDGQQIITAGAGVWDERKVNNPYYINEFSPDGTAILWDAASGRDLRTFEGHTDRINSVAFSPDGRQLLTGSLDETAILWDVVSGRKLRTLQGHTGPVLSVAFSPDGNKVLTGATDKMAILWDAATGRKLRTLKGHASVVPSVAFSPDGLQILTGSHDLILWDNASGKKLKTIQRHKGTVTSVAFSPDGLKVLTESYEGTASLWSIATGDELLTYWDYSDAWLVTTPEGLFDGSVRGREMVSYRIGDGLNVVPVDRFFKNFHYPGLLTAIMSNERPLPKIAIGKQLPPAIQIISPERWGTTEETSATIVAVVEDKGGGIKEPFVKLNNSHYVVDEKPVRDGNKLRWRFSIPLITGVESTIEVHSASADGSWESEPARIVLKCEKPKQRPELYMVAVGITDYADGERFDLTCARNDAETLAQLFRKRGEPFYGIGKVHVTTVLDNEATAKGIEAAIAEVAKKAKPHDVFVLSLSGHGRTLSQRYYFIPYEFQSGGETRIDDRIRKQAVPHDELNDWIAMVAATKRVLIYDTCESGATITRNAFEHQHALESLARKSGCHIIAAASSTENAQELPEVGHGALTYALMAGLGAADRGILQNRTAQAKDGLVSTLDWFRFAHENVPELTSLSLGVKQYPTYSPGQSDFPLLPIKAKK